jgi:hypothetical protein
MYVRVFDLYGASEALVSYPTDEQPSVRTQAGKSIALGGPLGFEAIPSPGFQSERFLVVAAPTEPALKLFAKAKGECRVPADLARDLTAGRGIPAGIKVATTGYRIITGPACPQTDGPRQGTVPDMSSLPTCSF